MLPGAADQTDVAMPHSKSLDANMPVRFINLHDDGNILKRAVAEVSKACSSAGTRQQGASVTLRI